MRYFYVFVVPLAALFSFQCAVARTRLEACPENLDPVCDSLEPGAETVPMGGIKGARGSVEKTSAGEVKKICRDICNRFARLFRTLHDCIRDHAEEPPAVGPIPCSVGRLSACRDARRTLEADWDPARFAAEMRWVCSGDSERTGWAAIFRANAWARCLNLGHVARAKPTESEVESYLGVLETMHGRCEGKQMADAAASMPSALFGSFAGLSSLVGGLELEPGAERKSPKDGAHSREQTMDTACASLGYFGPTRKGCPIYNCRSMACELFSRHEFPPDSPGVRQFQQRFGCTAPASPTAVHPFVELPVRMPAGPQEPVGDDTFTVDMNNF